MRLSQLSAAFERLARDYLGQHPEVPHEWRDVHSRWWGDRRDLICGPSTACEVYASLLGRQIAVGRAVNGRSEIDEDFEDFGRGLGDEVIARQAFEFFLKLLAEAGYAAPAV